MNIHEAIEQAEEKGREDSPCAEDNRQLALWLRELQTMREAQAVGLVGTLKEVCSAPGGADFDIALFALAKGLGAMPANQDFQEVKGIFWSNNPYGNQLYGIFSGLVAQGWVTFDMENQTYTWIGPQEV